MHIIMATQWSGYHVDRQDTAPKRSGVRMHIIMTTQWS